MSDEGQYPSFSPTEFERRISCLREVMEKAKVEVVVICGAGRSAAEIQYFTNWIVQREGLFVVTDHDDPTLYVQYYNHVPTAERMSVIRDVRWAGADSGKTLVDHLAGRHVSPTRIGYVGDLKLPYYFALREAFPDSEFVDLTPAIVRLRIVKSDEELQRLAKAASITDVAVEELLDRFEVGMTDRDVVALIQAAHASAGGTTQVAFVGSTSMDSPSLCVPAQRPANRPIRRGDVLLTEISAEYWGYAGQVLRTFAAETELDSRYASLHSIALEVFESIFETLREGATLEDIHAAAEPVRREGFTIFDDLIHGYGGGYLPPIVRAADFRTRSISRFVFQANMVVVIQPNVITEDGRSGVQLGEMVRVTASGAERMHGVSLDVLRLN